MKRFHVIIGCVVWAGVAGCEAESAESVDGPGAVVQDEGEGIDERTLAVLLEEHAAPAFGLKGREVWEAYEDGALQVVEVVPDGIYRLTYGDGILEVILNEND